ncbi:MAG: hypothetical protein G01um101433_204 [Parcubacteria group bacterium Gr01-1014_33]|nr:MAG: hypothetical protein G01um101433_204 [Parcubacteria group bacterium Gr01-1014_33]
MYTHPLAKKSRFCYNRHSMHTAPPLHRDTRLGKDLILDERFDLLLYEKFRDYAKGDLNTLLEELIAIESKHVVFWENFFGIQGSSLNLGRRLKLAIFTGAAFLFGEKVIHLLLEAIEVYGIRKYLRVWEMYKDTALGEALEGILHDEMAHEDVIVSRLVERSINPARVRNIFLGFNDGLVETLGAISGFFAAFDRLPSIVLAAFTVAVAGSFSMGAGVFLGTSSENEVKRLEAGRKEFLKGVARKEEKYEQPLASGFIVAIFYFIGALIPISPVLFGFENLFLSVAISAGFIILISLVLSFLSGMDIGRRILLNLLIIAGAVVITYAIGIITRQIWGVRL